MKLTFYNNKDTTNTINKDLTELSTIDINFKQGQNMYTPSLVLTKTNVPPLSNYVKLAEKFYFINSTYEFHTTYLIINLIEDVLETYKDDILKSETDVTSKSKIDYNSTVATNSKVTTDIVKSNITLPDAQSIIVQTNGTTDKPINL